MHFLIRYDLVFNLSYNRSSQDSVGICCSFSAPSMSTMELSLRRWGPLWCSRLRLFAPRCFWSSIRQVLHLVVSVLVILNFTFVSFMSIQNILNTLICIRVFGISSSVIYVRFKSTNIQFWDFLILLQLFQVFEIAVRIWIVILRYGFEISADEVKWRFRWVGFFEVLKGLLFFEQLYVFVAEFVHIVVDILRNVMIDISLFLLGSRLDELGGVYAVADAGWDGGSEDLFI